MKYIFKLKKYFNQEYYTYCISTELAVVPEPYRTLIKFLGQNTSKLFDKNLR